MAVRKIRCIVPDKISALILIFCFLCKLLKIFKRIRNIFYIIIISWRKRRFSYHSLINFWIILRTFIIHTCNKFICWHTLILFKTPFICVLINFFSIYIIILVVFIRKPKILAIKIINTFIRNLMSIPVITTAGFCWYIIRVFTSLIFPVFHPSVTIWIVIKLPHINSFFIIFGQIYSPYN